MLLKKNIKSLLIKIFANNISKNGYRNENKVFFVE